MSRLKGVIKRSYPVRFKNKHYPDAETAYQVLKPQAADNVELMAEIIVAKFKQHSDLADEVAKRGGARWLRGCTHFTNAKSEGAQRWEGAGMDSLFIQVLVDGYERFLRGDNTELGQTSLF
ncbi:hypothetical protein AS149_14135 [Burkholderia cenocepacia]|nr:hypothetical protein AS149_14135 [Burkholderia cenocepacia]